MKFSKVISFFREIPEPPHSKHAGLWAQVLAELSSTEPVETSVSEPKLAEFEIFGRIAKMCRAEYFRFEQ